MSEVELQEEINRLWKLNRELNRRCQQIESPWIKERDQAKAEAAMWRNHWGNEFDRLGRSFDYCKEIYELCAKKLNLPYGKYHSVNDCSYAKGYGKYVIVATPILPCGNKVEHYEILSVVEKAIIAPSGLEERK